MRVRSRLAGKCVVLTVALALVGVGSVDASAEAAPPSAVSAKAIGPLGPLADLTVRRARLGDKVAAAKFGTSLPIDDPVREKQLLDTVTAESQRLGLPVSTSVRIFQAQIEANKVVQRGLFQRWQEHPAERPTERPDLAKEVRPLLDQITAEILRELLATRNVRTPGPACAVHAAVAELSADLKNRLDALHRKAVHVALRPVCAP